MAPSALLEIFVGLLSIVFFIAYWRSNHGIPKNLPIVGMMPYLIIHINHFHEWTSDLFSYFSTFVFKGIWFTGQDLIVTTEPDDVNYIFNTNFRNYPKGEDLAEVFDIFGKGMVTQDNEPWMAIRRVMKQIFSDFNFIKFSSRITQQKLENGFLPVLDSLAKAGKVVDFTKLAKRLSFDINFMSVNGLDPATLSPDFPHLPYLNSMDVVEEAIFYRHALPKVVWKFMRKMNLGVEKRYSEAWKALDIALADALGKKKQQLEVGDGESASMLDHFLRECNFDDSLIRDLMCNFMLAGKNTISTAFTWLIWLLSMNKEAETKIREEINSLLSPEERSRRRVFTAEEVKKMTYLHCALSETIRLYPPIGFELKSPLQPDVLPSGHHVTPSQKIIVFFYCMGRMANIWGEDCREFKPERWIDENGGIKYFPPHKFVAFHAGPRICLGKDMAYTQLKMMTAALLHNYEVQVLEGQKITIENSLILQMKNKLKVKITKKWN